MSCGTQPPVRVLADHFIAAAMMSSTGLLRRAARPSIAIEKRSLSTYCVTVANITVSVPDEVYHAARIMAAEARTSVSALVREYLIRIVAQGSEFRRRVDLQEEILDGIQAGASGISASKRMTRGAEHDRDALR